jgi:4'-phosphopantetheinyl transferase
VALSPPEVHLACGGVAALLRSAPDPEGWLSDGERTRLARIGTASRRDQFVAARWQARLLLAQVAEAAPERWRLSAPMEAPPQVEGRPEWRLSVSHSGDAAAAALALAPVGIDVEVPRRRHDIEGLVALCCTAREQALLAPLAAVQRAACFHELWTVKESWLKARGEAMAPGRLREIEAAPATCGPVRTWRTEDGCLALCAHPQALLRWCSPEPAAARAWSVRDLRPACSPPR